MIDIHCHILPGVDDGARNLTESLLMADMAINDGIKGIVCTPHWLPGMFDTRRSFILSAVDELRQELQQRGLDMQLYPGAELRLDPAIPAGISNGDLLTLNDTGNYALIELPEAVVPQHLDQFFWGLQARGVTPILCHPERNFSFLQNHVLLWRLVEMGALVQITSGSLLGRFGRKIRDFSVLLLRHRMVHVIASDAHSPYGRTPRLMEAFREAEKIVGIEASKALVCSNPQQILEGLPLELPGPIPLSQESLRTSILGRILSGIGLKWR